MTAILHFLQAHAYWSGIGTLWVFSAFIGGMPAPDSTSSKGYLWLYGSLHLLGANLDKVGQSVSVPKS